MVQGVPLGGKWWAHTGDCNDVQMDPHVHYGQNVIVTNPKMLPADVLAAYNALFDTPLRLETTDMPPLETTS